MSRRRSAAARLYMAAKARFLWEHPVCEICAAGPILVDENFSFKIVRCSVDVHHKAGRSGKNYLDEGTWMAVCRECHDWIYQHPKEARARGWLK